MKTKPPDYCSGVPDFDWGERACKPHDDAYERGGWILEKLKADAKLAWHIATTPHSRALDLTDHLTMVRRVHRKLEEPGRSMEERDRLIDEMRKLHKRIDRAVARHNFSKWRHRLWHLAAAPVFGLGVVILHPVYKVWGWTRGKQVGFRWGRRNS